MLESPVPAPLPGTLPFQSPVNAGRPGILIVDDEPLLLQLLQTACQARGFKVWVAQGGNAGVDLFRQHHDELSLILLDIRMPDLDGPATLAEILEIDSRPPCCFMSGHLGTYTAEELRDLGAVRLFTKPFRLLEMIEELWAFVPEGLRRSA